MRARAGALVAGVVLAVTMTAGPAVAGGGPNQGNPDFVIKVDNPYVRCDYPKALDKVEGDFGRSIHVRSYHPIDKVTIKSGRDAYVVSSEFDTYWGKIKLSKDVSNYVVWVCKKHY